MAGKLALHRQIPEGLIVRLGSHLFGKAGCLRGDFFLARAAELAIMPCPGLNKKAAPSTPKFLLGLGDARAFDKGWGPWWVFTEDVHTHCGHGLEGYY